MSNYKNLRSLILAIDGNNQINLQGRTVTIVDVCIFDAEHSLRGAELVPVSDSEYKLVLTDKETFKKPDLRAVPQKQELLRFDVGLQLKIEKIVDITVPSVESVSSETAKQEGLDWFRERAVKAGEIINSIDRAVFDYLRASFPLGDDPVVHFNNNPSGISVEVVSVKESEVADQKAVDL